MGPARVVLTRGGMGVGRGGVAGPPRVVLTRGGMGVGRGGVAGSSSMITVGLGFSGVGSTRISGVV